MIFLLRIIPFNLVNGMMLVNKLSMEGDRLHPPENPLLGGYSFLLSTFALIGFVYLLRIFCYHIGSCLC